jgi:hypothetical protein
MQTKKRRIILFLIGLLFFSAVFLIRIQDDMVDFQVHYYAGQRLCTGENLYQTEDGHFMFKYLPFSALLYVPLSYLPLGTAKVLWYALTVVCTVFLFAVSYRLARSSDQPAAYLAILPPLILAKFFFREMKLGQINTIVTSIMLIMVWTMRDERKLTSRRQALTGGLWGLATALKPYGFIFFPYFLVKGNWRALLAGTGTILLSLMIPALFYGWEGNLLVHRQWASTLSQSTPSLFTTADNVSIMAFWVKWTGNESLSFRISGLLIVTLAFLLLAVIMRGRTFPNAAVLECAALLTLIPLVSPLGWDYTFLASVLAVTLLVHLFFVIPKVWRWLLVANFCVISLTIYDILGRTFYGSFMAWSVLTLNFLVVVGYLTYLRFSRAC